MQSLKQLTINNEVVEWIVEVLSQATAEERKQRQCLGPTEAAPGGLVGADDKLDGAISEDEQYAPF
ncbi:hypothetical protein [Geobacter sp. SVR]|uniref:hypothetical protein n=1 Tax=Geobacter sp. SVR TaxID=2495594 RepID=UPI00143EFE73|nr:hypothetical protein [Geobacter sp. SVR]BCS55622.1 hypothetical protein GSVR_39300 [Geobacter sp. SVR]GCF83625.1 hypothetical protein GSbR_02250 [Geobacter sp. SVR]